MKKVYILRHANKDKVTGELTEEGRERARQLKDKLGNFDMVIGSNRPRIIDTAKLLTGKDPIIDERAGFVYDSDEQDEKLGKLAKLHPLTHAGVLFENPEFKELTELYANNLISLTKETLAKLPENGKALIVSQDGVMVAGEKKLRNKPYEPITKSYEPLEGYIVNENLEIEEIAI